MWTANAHFLITVIFAAGLGEVIIYSSPDDNKKNRGFCFLEYESHKAASLAKRRLGTGRTKVCSFEKSIIFPFKCQSMYPFRCGGVILSWTGLILKRNQMHRR